jgi:hypothetical protein
MFPPSFKSLFAPSVSCRPYFSFSLTFFSSLSPPFHFFTSTQLILLLLPLPPSPSSYLHPFFLFASSSFISLSFPFIPSSYFFPSSFTYFPFLLHFLPFTPFPLFSYSFLLTSLFVYHPLLSALSSFSSLFHLMASQLTCPVYRFSLQSFPFPIASPFSSFHPKRALFLFRYHFFCTLPLLF